MSEKSSDAITARSGKSAANLALVKARRVQVRRLVTRRLRDGTSVQYYVSEKKIDISGCRFSSWTVLHYDRKINNAHFWMCRCDCGTLRSVQYGNLAFGASQICGCIKNHFVIHGKTNTRTWIAWQQMKARCLNQNRHDYKYYGARGINICQRWLDSFQNFLDDLGECPAGFTLERVGVNGNYCPENCKWIPKGEQSNNRRNTIRLSFNGEVLLLAKWAAKIGIHRDTLYARLFCYGWPIQQALATKLLRQNKIINAYKKKLPPV